MKFIAKKLSTLYFICYRFFYGNIKYARLRGVAIGEKCRIYVKDWGSEPYLISIGNNVTVAAGTRFITHDGSAWLFRNNQGRYYKYGKIKVGHNVFIGMDVLIFPGVVIGDNVIIGAGSVVTKSLEPNSVYVGNPAKKLKTIDEFISTMENTYIHTSAVSPELTDKERVFEMLSVAENR